MRNPLIAILLCALATTAGAYDAAGAAATASKPDSVTAAKTEPARKAELIGTAAAAVHDPSEVVRAPRPRSAQGEDPSHDGGLAMLLAAIAVMAGIALRRLGSRYR